MRTAAGLFIALLLGLFPADRLGAQEMGSPEHELDALGPTPPRLSLVDGQVSFFRPGAQEWTPAQVNMPLSPGDRLQSGSPGNLEIQIGERAFLRGWANTRIELTSQDSDHLRINLEAGHVAFDLRALEPGHTVEVETPNAAFTIDQAGYYRMDVAGERTTFSARRGGRAVVDPADGASFEIFPDEAVAIAGENHPAVSTYSAPPPDPWDHWNQARTDALLAAQSARYVPPGVYGASDLDRYGQWRSTPDYGPVWTPTGVPAGWAPYSTGNWVQDPFYGWTWVDSAPWGWAPYHYGRWVYVERSWCWAPGPRPARPVYSPALVAFYGGARGGGGFGADGPVVGWVALGGGEPCVPWWGRPGFIHRPWWGGWAGPRVVNNVVVRRTAGVRAEHVHDYRNARVHNAVVGVREDHFHRGAFKRERFVRMDARELQPMPSAPRINARSGNFGSAGKHGLRPPENDLKHPVGVTRPAVSAEPPERRERTPHETRASSPGRFIERRPEVRENPTGAPRPSFGRSGTEGSPEAGRAKEAAPPKTETAPPRHRYPEPQPPVVHRPPQPSRPSQPTAPAERPGHPVRPDKSGAGREKASPSPPQHRIEGSPPPVRQQPSAPAGRLVLNRYDERSARGVKREADAPQRFEQRHPPADGKRPAPYQDAPARGGQRPVERPFAFPRTPGNA
jgi:hypothetical protein